MARRIHAIGLDIAKDVFQVHAVDAKGRVVLRKQLKRLEMPEFFRSLAPCLVGTEATGEAHNWGRILRQFGHDVRLMPPGFVKPYVKTNKNDANDAEAICEAVQRPNMRFVSIKSRKRQAHLVIHRARELFVRQRTHLINALRSHLREFGIVANKGADGAKAALTFVGSASFKKLPLEVGRVLRLFVGQLESLKISLERCEELIESAHRGSAGSQRLATIPYIGPLTATAIVATVGDAKQFRRARDFAAWVGLVPRQLSSGGKQRLGHISKRGNFYLRKLLFLAAARAARSSKFARTRPGKWALSLRKRKAYRVAIVALAAKMARIAWAILVRKKEFQGTITSTA